LQIANPLKL